MLMLVKLSLTYLVFQLIDCKPEAVRCDACRQVVISFYRSIYFVLKYLQHDNYKYTK